MIKEKEILQDNEKFEDSIERIKAYEKWIAIRDNWAEKQRIIEKLVASLLSFSKLTPILSVNLKHLNLWLGMVSYRI